MLTVVLILMYCTPPMYLLLPDNIKGIMHQNMSYLVAAFTNGAWNSPVWLRTC